MKAPKPHRGKPMKPAAPPMAGKAGGLIQGPASSALKGLQRPVTQSVKTDRGVFGIK
jgi:hypothetical protein